MLPPEVVNDCSLGTANSLKQLGCGTLETFDVKASGLISTFTDKWFNLFYIFFLT
jgi:hypothetical protein